MMASKIKPPILKINGRTYTPVRPKIKTWYDFAVFIDGVENMEVPAYIEGSAKLIASMYKDVTAQDIMDNFDIARLKPFFFKVYGYIVQLTNESMDADPNGATVADQ